MVDRDYRLRHGRIAQHAFVKSEKIQVSEALVLSSPVHAEASTSADHMSPSSSSRRRQVSHSDISLPTSSSEDMHFNNYVDHRETRPFNNIILYSVWLACGSRLTFLHLPERVMRQFNYTQTISRHLVVSAPPAMTYRDMNLMFDDYLSHLIMDEVLSAIVESDWSYIDVYLKWFFRVSHPYMVQAALGDPLMSAHQKLLEEEQTQLDH
ncbi:uncharacterized protein LOC127137843 [Lathyrus oleraceus]|uniref:uncharacterized protein LOC127137843 n=1 Tax=Pisum sativum TaxID=3888 RepID=UPI0021D34205|nr:uncharacterized protein LOC127137843 [Pisum sativum]